MLTAERKVPLRRTGRRRLLAAAGTLLGVAVGGASALAACAPGLPSQPGAAGEQGAGSGPVRAPSAPVTVSVWHSWHAARTPLFEKILADFQSKHPTIRPEHTVIIPGPEVLQKLQTAAAGGTPPDLYNPYRSDLPLLAEIAVPLALDSYARRDRFELSQFYDSEVESSRFRGKLFLLPAIPHNADGFVFFNRQQVRGEGLDFDRTPPKTWDDLEAAARRFVRRDAEGLSHLGLPIGLNHRSLRAWLGTNGALLVSPDGRKAALAEPRALDVVQWMLGFRTRVNGGREAQAAFSRRSGSGSGSPVTTGFQAMALHNPGVWFNVKAAVPEFDLGLFLIPVKTGAQLALPATYLSWGYGAAAASRQPEACWLLLKYVAADEAAAGWFFREQNRPSPVKRFNEHPEYRQRHPQWDEVLRYMASARADTVLPVDAEIVRTLNEELAAVDQEKVAPAPGLKSAAERLQTILDGYWARAGR